jgi:sugar/nucleoside kinase (ribokinase family)
VYQDGERSFLHAPGTNGLLTDESIDEEALSQMDAFLLAGLGILPGLDGKSMGWLMAKAKGQRVVTAVDTADGGRGLGEAIELLMPSLRFVDYLFVSEAEHQQFTGKTDPLSSVKFLLEHGALQVFLKLGEDGVLYGNDAGVLAHWPAFEVVAKNTTGCGDAFAAAAVYRVLEGASVEQSCRYAAAVSGLIAQIGEGAKSITSATQVHDFLGRAVLRKPSRVLV